MKNITLPFALKRVPYQTDQNHPAIQEYKAAVEKGKKNQHVFPIGDGWVIKNLWTGKISRLFQTKKEALKEAEAIARDQKNSVFIHGSDGRIKERKDY